jgi:hypothetical protein
MPHEAWGGVKPVPGSEDTGYCTHSSVLFPTWHRPYMALYEVRQVFSCHRVDEPGSRVCGWLTYFVVASLARINSDDRDILASACETTVRSRGPQVPTPVLGLGCSSAFGRECPAEKYWRKSVYRCQRTQWHPADREPLVQLQLQDSRQDGFQFSCESTQPL